MNDRTADPFLAKAEDRLTAVMAEEKALMQQLEGVMRRRQEKITEIMTIRRSIELYHELMDPGSTLETSPGQLATSLEPSATVADLVHSWLTDHEGRGRVKDILRALVRSGKFEDDSNGNYSIVYTALSRDPRIEKVGRGEFALKAAESSVVELHEVTPQNWGRWSEAGATEQVD